MVTVVTLNWKVHAAAGPVGMGPVSGLPIDPSRGGRGLVAPPEPPVGTTVDPPLPPVTNSPPAPLPPLSPPSPPFPPRSSASGESESSPPCPPVDSVTDASQNSGGFSRSVHPPVDDVTIARQTSLTNARCRVCNIGLEPKRKEVPGAGPDQA